MHHPLPSPPPAPALMCSQGADGWGGCFQFRARRRHPIRVRLRRHGTLQALIARAMLMRARHRLLAAFRPSPTRPRHQNCKPKHPPSRQRTCAATTSGSPLRYAGCHTVHLVLVCVTVHSFCIEHICNSCAAFTRLVSGTFGTRSRWHSRGGNGWGWLKSPRGLQRQPACAHRKRKSTAAIKCTGPRRTLQTLLLARLQLRSTLW